MKQRTHLGIKQKLSIILTAIAVMILLVGSVSLLGIRKINKGSEIATKQTIPQMRIVQEALTSFINVERNREKGAHAEEVSELDQHLIQLEKTGLKFKMFISALTWGSESDAFKKSENGLLMIEWKKLGLEKTLAIEKIPAEQAQLAGRINIYFGAFYKYSKEHINFHRKHNPVFHKKLMHAEEDGQDPEIKKEKLEEGRIRKQVDYYFALTIESLNKMTEISNIGISSLIHDIEKVNRTVFFIILLTVVIGFVLTIFLSDIFVKRVITNPLSNLMKAVQKISKGDWSKRAKVGSEDEIGQLAGAFNKIAEELITSFNNLKAQKEKVEQAKAKDEAILSSIGEALVVINQKGNFILFNKEAKRLFGLTSEHIGRSLHSYIKLKDKSGREVLPEKKPISLALKKGKTISEMMYITKGKEKIPFVITASPVLFKKKIIGAISLYHDITKEMEIDRAKSEFVSLASHQLRTPLTSINWILQKALERGITDKWEKEFVGDALEANKRITKLVNDLLNISRLEAGGVDVSSEKTDLTIFISKIIKEVGTLTKAHNQKIKFKKTSKSLIVSLDQKLIGQVINNLISNSIKYSNPKTTITVSAEKKGRNIEIKVQDQGIGISKENQKRLFERFFRSEEATKLYTRGSGLGLYIIKKILTLCNGKIDYKSQKGKGSTFIITLPPKGPISKKIEQKKFLEHKIS